jgi:integrase
MKRIKVKLVKLKSRPSYLVRWTDPTTGRDCQRTTGCKRKRDAEREAARVEDELNAGTYVASRVPWDEFRDRVEREFNDGRKPGGVAKIVTTLNKVERLIDPRHVDSIDAEAVRTFERRLKAEGAAKGSIYSHLGTLKAILNWAASDGVRAIENAPRFPKLVAPDSGGGAFGEDDFERMLAAVRAGVCERSRVRRTRAVLAVCRAEAAGDDATPQRRRIVAEDRKQTRLVAEWTFFLRGLYWSGLRLAEALALTWDRSDCWVDLESGTYRIDASLSKNGKSTVAPAAPEFVDQLREVPEWERTGPVLAPTVDGQRTRRVRIDTAGKTVRRIAERAGVEVVRGDGKSKVATAHDFRRTWHPVVQTGSPARPQATDEARRHRDDDAVLRHRGRGRNVPRPRPPVRLGGRRNAPRGRNRGHSPRRRGVDRRKSLTP